MKITTHRPDKRQKTALRLRLTLGLSLVAFITGFTGCASQAKLTQEQILNQHQEVASLNTALEQAKSKGAELLAPEGYASASKSLSKAMSAAENNNIDAAKSAANDGLKNITKLNRDTESSRKILAEVLQARERAFTAGAKTLQAEKLAELDNELKDTSALIENGKIEKAKQIRPELVQGYAQLELKGLKQNTQNLAKSSIATAKKQDAHKNAPKTFARAEEELALAVTILDADRTQTSKADLHAKNAKWLAEQSAQISETIKDFDRRDYTMEDVVLWHQDNLKTINQPLGGQLPFNQPADTVVTNLKNSVNNVIEERDAAVKQLKSADEQYGKQLAVTEKERKAQLQKEREDRQKFDKIQAMFNSKEANVYRQHQNVLISAHGFAFPSGQSEIQTVNFPLMKKITEAIKIFPKARIEVDGHTDSMGDGAANKKLSLARAQKVAKFLNEVGEIDASKITSRGFGESKPVATNKTPAGRAENRRVEIRIINE